MAALRSTLTRSAGLAVQAQRGVMPGMSVRAFGSESLDDCLKTSLFDLHVEDGGKMVPFAGYQLPVQYKEGVLKSHLHTREEGKASIFDVSHMGQLKIHGKDRAAFLETLVVGDVSRLAEQNAILSLLTTEQGTIIDDTIITNAGDHIGMVVNGACKHKDLAHMHDRLAEFDGDASIEHLEDRQLIALQGDGAATVLQRLVGDDLSKLGFMTGYDMAVDGMDCGVMRCGYTGEDGFELSVSWADAPRLWSLLRDQEEVWPAALGPRDSLRLEAGLCLYGHDIDDTVTPLEATLRWTIPKHRLQNGGFLGAEVLQQQLKDGLTKHRVGFALEGRAPAREGAEIYTADGETKIGVVTSGTFSPCLQAPVSMGYVAHGYQKRGTAVSMKIRKKFHPAVVAKMPFVEAKYYKP